MYICFTGYVASRPIAWPLPLALYQLSDSFSTFFINSECILQLLQLEVIMSHLQLVNGALWSVGCGLRASRLRERKRERELDIYVFV